MAAGRLGAPHQIEADGMIVRGGAIELEPEHVGRQFGDTLDGRAADRAERIGNARALRGAGEISIGARPHDRRPAHRRNADRRGVAAAEQFDLARRQRRHHAIARHQFHRIEPRPIALDAGIVLARAAVGIFEGKMRQPAARAAAQIVDGRIVPVKLGIARIGVLADVRFWRGGLRCGYGRRIVHGRFSGRHYSAFIAPPEQATRQHQLSTWGPHHHHWAVVLINRHVRSTPRCGRKADIGKPPLSAITACTHRSKQHLYSITSSAMASTPAGMARPSTLAVVRLMARSNLVGCSTGRSPGFVPRRILSTNSAARRN